MALSACGRSAIDVPRGPHRPAAEEPPLRVSKMPPPAKIEVVPLQRNEECRYLDGHYEPVAGSWQWAQGAWVQPPANCYYAAPVTRYEKIQGGTTLVHRPGVWLERNEDEGACPAPTPCSEYE